MGLFCLVGDLAWRGFVRELAWLVLHLPWKYTRSILHNTAGFLAEPDVSNTC